MMGGINHGAHFQPIHVGRQVPPRWLLREILPFCVVNSKLRGSPHALSPGELFPILYLSLPIFRGMAEAALYYAHRAI